MHNTFNRKAVNGLFVISLSVLTACAPSSAPRWMNQAGTVLLPGIQLAQDVVSKQKDVLGIISKNDSVQTAIPNSEHTLNFDQRVESEGIETLKYQHYYKGIQVLGSMALYHETKIKSEVDNQLAQFDLQIEPTLSEKEAVQIARGETGDRDLLNAPSLIIMPSPDKMSAKLVYVVTVSPKGIIDGSDVYVDAHSGEVIADISHKQSIADVNVYVTNSDMNCQTSFGGSPIVSDFKSCDLVIEKGVPVADKSIGESQTQAKGNALAVLNYYQNTFNRNSFDNKGTTLSSLTEVGTNFVNAWWDGQSGYMAYGTGDMSVGIGNMTRSLDVAGHEMTHGVVGTTAKLIYKSESGALNEGLADFFGVLIAGTGWDLGRSIYVDQTKAKGIRNLLNPGMYNYTTRDASGNKVTKPYPAKVSEMFKPTGLCSRTNDNCGVHINSTVMSHSFYRVHEAIGKTKSEKIFYTALTQFLTAQSGFQDMKVASVKACVLLNYSTDASTGDCAKVGDAFKQAEL